LNVIERDWASFCGAVADSRQEIDDHVSQWVDFNNSHQSLNVVLLELLTIIDEDNKDKFDHGSLQHFLTRYQVCIPCRMKQCFEIMFMLSTIYSR